MNAEDAGSSIRIALTGDFRASDGEVYFDAQALDSLKRLPGAMLSVQDAPVGTPLDAATLREFDAVVMKRSPVSADILESDDLRTVLIARNGVGVEHIDLEACTRRGVMVANTPESVRRPMASSAMTMILALAHRLLEKNRAAREGRWIDRHRYRGTGLSDRVLGLIGCGNIGMDLLGLSAPWGMERLVFDPYQDPGRIAAAGAEPVDFDDLLARSDFIVLSCPLTDATRRIVDGRAIGRMKPGAFLVNVARGGLVDEAALIAALAEGRLGGAGLDVFDPEPPAADNPLLTMENVIATAHNMGFSDESNRLGNRFAAAAVEAVARGAVPANLVNPGVLDHPRVRAFLGRRSGTVANSVVRGDPNLREIDAESTAPSRKTIPD